MSYDIIGDIHGQAGKLRSLLARLGYVERQGVWRHPSRQVLFVGDFIDRGPEQLESVRIARRMVDAGNARAIMGNHELNAIAFALPDPERPGEHLRGHSDKNRSQHRAFLEAVGDDDRLHQELVDWFLTLPLWLDLGPLRLVHACWHPGWLEYLRGRLAEGRLTRELMVEASRKPPEGERWSPEPSMFKAVEALTKGLETPLPPGHSFRDADGHTRAEVRVRWWSPEATTYRRAAMLAEEVARGLPDEPIPEHLRVAYSAGPPVFIGHYWLTGRPGPLSARVACVDYSAGRGGPLVAYRWEGEEEIQPEHFWTSD